MLTAVEIRRRLGPLAERIPIQVIAQCTSTNLLVKSQAAELPPWHTLIAAHQTAGRGRLGRSFYSPAGTGLYMSVLLRPLPPAEAAPLITPAAAVAVCRALEDLGSDQAEIKWVNDVYIRGRKVCGILTETRPDLSSAVLGIGVNVTEPPDGFPPEAGDLAGAVFPQTAGDRRGELAAAILRSFYELYPHLESGGFAEEYRTRSFLVGRWVTVLGADGPRRALVMDVDARCRLSVRYESGAEELLFTGEVTIRPDQA